MAEGLPDPQVGELLMAFYRTSATHDEVSSNDAVHDNAAVDGADEGKSGYLVPPDSSHKIAFRDSSAPQRLSD